MPLRDLFRRNAAAEDASCESDSGSVAESADSKPLDLPEQLSKAARRLRTEKARASALLSKQRSRLEEQRNQNPLENHPAAHFRPDLQPSPETNRFAGGACSAPSTHRRRVRVLYSWFKSWCASLLNYLQASTVNHCFTVNIVDDTSMRLAETMPGAPRSSEVFLSYVSGTMGCELVATHINLLVEFSCLGLPEFVESFFEMVLQQMGEFWRRFHHEQMKFPNRMFELTNLDHTNFLTKYRQFQGLERICPECIDLEFSSVLLAYIPEDSSPEAHSTLEKVKQIQRFLKDLTVFAPLSADLVECLHGTCQSKHVRFRGCRPSDPIAREITIHEKICGAYSKFKDWMWKHHGDHWARKRMCAYGTCKGNQYTEGEGRKRLLTKKRPLTFDDLDGMLASSKLPRTPRKICGGLVEQAMIENCVKM
eukprot:Skav209131  [mRNA]  locus=scaffold682:262010:265350:+ [translate_table: standard]